MSTSTAVLIIGAGPAGLLLALSFRKNGIPVRIIEKDTQFHIGSRGTGIQARTMEIMRFLGVYDDIQQASYVKLPMKTYKIPGSTEPFNTSKTMDPKAETTPACPLTGALIGQNKTEEILRSHLKKYDCSVELGAELLDFQQDEQGVTAHVLHYEDGKHETFRVEFLVGADGAKGIVRRHLGLEFLGETRDADGMVIGDVVVKSGIDADFWHMWGLDGATIMLRPAGGNNCDFHIYVLGKNFDHEKLAEPEALKKFFHEKTGRREIEFGEFTWLTHFRPNMRMVNKFGEGRVFVVGDAAHVHSPTGGQGLNSSVQDSFNLAWKIALVHKSLAPISLLSTYTVERLPVIKEMLRLTTGLYTLVTAGGDASMKAWDRSRTLWMLGINYRWSPIVLDGRSPAAHETQEELQKSAYGGYEHGLRAGDRAPDAPGLVSVTREAEMSLFGIFDVAKHTILVFPQQGTEQVDGVLQAARGCPAGTIQTVIISRTSLPKSTDVDLALVDRDGHAHDGYLIEDGSLTVVIVRPDGYIGAIVKDATGVAQYFSAIFCAA